MLVGLLVLLLGGEWLGVWLLEQLVEGEPLVLVVACMEEEGVVCVEGVGEAAVVLVVLAAVWHLLLEELREVLGQVVQQVVLVQLVVVPVCVHGLLLQEVFVLEVVLHSCGHVAIPG